MASPRLCPESRCITMFSTTTIASSITRPTAAAKPPKVIKLKPRPIMRMAIIVIANAADGIAYQYGLIVERLYLHAGRKRLPDLIELGRGGIRYRNGIAIGLA